MESSPSAFLPCANSIEQRYLSAIDSRYSWVQVPHLVLAQTVSRGAPPATRTMLLLSRATHEAVHPRPNRQSGPRRGKHLVISCEACNKAHGDRSIWAFREETRRDTFLTRYRTTSLASTARRKPTFSRSCGRRVSSEVFHRYHRIKTELRAGTLIQHTVARKRQERFRYRLGKEGKEVNYTASFDDNSLYTWAYMNLMPCGAATPSLAPSPSSTRRSKAASSYGFVQ